MADRKPAAALDQLAALNELELIHGDPLADLDRLVLLAADICGADLACFTVHDGATAHEVSSSFGPRASMPKLECMCSIPLASGQALHVADAAADSRLAAARYVASTPFVRSFLGVPVFKDAGSPVNAASILGVIALGIEQGDYVTLTADGAGAENTLDLLSDLLSTDHDAEA